LSARLVILATLIAVIGASCSDSTMDPEDRVGYNRTPAPEVSETEFIDYSTDPGGVVFAPVAPEGELLLMYFGYLSCPDVCPTTLAELSDALDAMPEGDAARISVGMVSVDPDRDEGPAISTYLDVFVDRNHGLLAPDAASLADSAEVFGALYEVEEHEPGDAAYDVGHSATVYVVDDRGLIIWELGFSADRDPQLTADTLESILNERYE
jgi:cytochrome oxidase Cu insertion factor (SCO1/SenC/PrrC family)